jgi:hypothetical protein
MRRGWCQLCGTMPPTFVRLTRRALERGQRNPRKRTNTFSMSTEDYAVTSGRWERSSPSLSSPVRPSPPLRRHCNATSSTAVTSPTLLRCTRTGHCNDRCRASFGPPSTPPSSRPAGGDRTSNLYTTTLEAAPVRAQDSPRRPNRSKICRDDRQLRGTARHAFTRRRIVRHAYELLSPWPIKGGAVPQPQGGTETDVHLHAFRLHPILALASFSTSGTWRTSLLSRLACSTPMQAPWCNAI